MTLNDAAQITKRSLAYFLIFLVLYIFGETLYKGFNYLYDKTFPQPPTPPEIAFGRIEELKINTLPIDLTDVEIRKELPISGFPEFNKTVLLYKIDQPRTSVAKEEKFKNIATKIGFYSTAEKKTSSERRWVDTVNNREFEAEIYFENFELRTNKTKLENELTQGESPSNAEAINTTKEFFEEIGMWNSVFEGAVYESRGVEIREGLTRVTELPYDEHLKFVSVKPLITAYTEVIQNDRGKPEEKENKLPVFFKNPTKPQISTLVGQSLNKVGKRAEVKDATYIYYNILEEKSQYPILEAKTAWNYLVGGKASLVYIKKDGSDYFAPYDAVNNIETIDIRGMELGYYMDNEIQEYLQPVYVFYGKFTTEKREFGDVYFYLPAIDPQVYLN